MKTYEFQAEIKEGRGGGFVHFPYDAREEFGTGGHVGINATFDSVPYRGSLAPMGGGTHVLGIRKDIRAQIGKGIGDTVEVTVQQDVAPRTVTVPDDFRSVLEADPPLAESFARLSYTRRKEIVNSIESAVKPATRQRRLEKALAELAA